MESTFSQLNNRKWSIPIENDEVLVSERGRIKDGMGERESVTQKGPWPVASLGLAHNGNGKWRDSSER